MSERADADDEFVDRETAVEAFALVGDETRLRIVDALARAHASIFRQQGLRFSELQTAAGVDDPGRFNYHLDRLQETFVVKRDGRYMLTYAGIRLFGDLEAGTYETDVEREPEPAAYPCPHCDERLRIGYGEHGIAGHCPEHGWQFGIPVPPGAIAGRNPTELLELADCAASRHIERSMRGVCPFCWGRATVTLPVSSADAPGFPDDAVVAELGCERCALTYWVPIGACVRTHPAVVAFYHEHGRDVRTIPLIALSFLRLDAATPIDGTERGDGVDPDAAVELTVDCEDDRLLVYLDADGSVVGTDRSDASA